jgi:hypothetical protein
VINEPTIPPPPIHNRASSAAVKVESEADLDGGDIIEAQRGVVMERSHYWVYKTSENMHKCLGIV